MTSKAESDIELALLTVARAKRRMPTRAATPEQIDLVCALRTLSAAIQPLLPRVVTGDAEPSDWAALADILDRTAGLCREQVMIEAAD